MRKKGGKLKKTLSKEFQKTFFVEVKEFIQSDIPLKVIPSTNKGCSEKETKIYFERRGFKVIRPNRKNFGLLSRKRKRLNQMFLLCFSYQWDVFRTFLKEFHKKGRPDFLARERETPLLLRVG